jgi:HAD superfamily hydrolase (TIGR01509 family)
MLSGVIFDMDGVLIDSHPAHKMAWRRFLEDVGRDVSDTDLEFVMGGRKRTDILRHFLGELSDDQLAEYGRKKDAHFLAIADSVNTIEGLLPFLGELERLGIKKAVATSASHSRANHMLARLELANHFSAVVTGDDVVNGKPDPAIFQRAAECLQKCPAELLVVEDAVAGIQAAKAAGMKCLGIGTDDRAVALLAAGADYVVADFTRVKCADLQQLLNQ